MGIEGRLKIDLFRKGGKIDRVMIASSRPVRIAHLFCGKTVAETLQTMPLIFSVCAMAQSFAAAFACERAMGIAEFEDTRNAREMIVMAESVREHLFRIALDWPQYIFGPSAPIDVKALMKLPGAMRRALFVSGAAFEPGARPQPDYAAVKALISDLDSFLKTEVYGEDIALWQGRDDYDALKDWAKTAKTIPARLINGIIKRGWERAGHGGTRFLPPVDDKKMLARLLRDDAELFAANPVWNGISRETGVLSRQSMAPLIKSLMSHCGCGLLTRLSARLCELARLPHDILVRLETGMKDGKPRQQSEGFGLAQIEAARGRLVHMVHIENRLVKDYRILAPTEWNFHPGGPAACALAHLDTANDEDMKMQVGLLINAIDPCVGFEVRLH